jgi:hypothetical protein
MRDGDRVFRGENTLPVSPSNISPRLKGTSITSEKQRVCDRESQQDYPGRVAARNLDTNWSHLDCVFQIQSARLFVTGMSWRFTLSINISTTNAQNHEIKQHSNHPQRHTQTFHPVFFSPHRLTCFSPHEPSLT